MSSLLLVFLVVQVGQPVDKPAAEVKPKYTTTSVQGHIVWLGDEVERDGISLAAEAAKGNLVLKESGGKLHPLLEDRRGHAFRLDPRLRANKVELLVRRSARHPFLQVLKVFEFDENDVKYELVYWCDICAITMFELKPCDCCQGQIELQRRKVKR
jgi:hypothetical protein